MRLKTLLIILMCTPILMLSQTLNDFTYTISQSQPTLNSNGDTVVVFTCSINVNDSLNVSAVELQMGTYPGGSNTASQLFVVGQNYGLPNNYSITSSPNMISICLGYTLPGVYHYRVKLYDTTGNSSAFLLFNSNTGQYSLQL